MTAVRLRRQLLELILSYASRTNEGTVTLVFQDADLIQLNKREIIRLEGPIETETEVEP
jgi:hypothetical protein